MSKKIVTTINNEKLPISQCRCYNKKYYKIGDINVENSGDCYKIDDKFYRVETGQIVYNNTDKKYCLKNNNLIYGLIENNNFGWFTNNNTIIKFYNQQNILSYALNEEILINNLNYREELSTGNYYHISLLPAKKFNIIKIPNKEYKFSLPYDSKGITDKHLEIYNNLYDSKVSIEVENLSHVLEDLTFGLEFETVAGYLPERITNKLGLIPLRDGSIPGLEYVTVPLKEAKGLQTVIDITKELEKRTKYDYKCSLHLHLGNIPRTSEFILAFFKITLHLQNELFTLFPIYKKYNLGIKNKNYSKPYPIFKLLNKIDPVITSENITKNFNVLMDYFLNKDPGYFSQNYKNDLNNVDYHPDDKSGNQKWNIRNRYYFHNFIPLIFGNKQTIEFRIHTPTYDVNKIFMFLLINSCLVNFTKYHQNMILKNPSFFDRFYNLETIIFEYFLILNKNLKKTKNINFKHNELYEEVMNYILTRKKVIELRTRNGEIVIDEEDIFINSKNWDCLRFIDTDYHKNKNIKLNSELDDILKTNTNNNIEQVELKTPVLKKSVLRDEHYYYDNYINDIYNFMSLDENKKEIFEKEILKQF